jgi:hypothetical protein
VCNDLAAGPKAFLHYQVEHRGRILTAGRTRATIPVCGSVFQGFLRFRAPSTRDRSQVIVRLALVDPEGKVLHDTAADLDVFPKPQCVPAERAYVVGRRNGKAHELACELGIAATFSGRPQPGDTILIDDLARFQSSRPVIERAVDCGATAVFLEIPVGEHVVAGETIAVTACGMGPRHFVARNTDHPLVRGFEPYDFRFWYDPGKGYVTPILDTTFVAPSWTPILLTGNGQWGAGEWLPTLAAADRTSGRGRYRICQVALANRASTNPAAFLFARRLLNAEGSG